ncbi:MAG: membrane dipeptidase [Myxococcota bacterium]|nr:membrane dipeptidase [Myxococcota bacterium]
MSIDARETRELAVRLGCSEHAVALAHASPLVDLHLDTFIPARLWGYRVHRRHRERLGGYFFGQGDLPRFRDGGYNGGMWSITTNPFRGAHSRLKTFQTNVTRLVDWASAHAEQVGLASSYREYVNLVAQGRHAIFLAVQGGNAIDAAPGSLTALSLGHLTRVTLVHLTNSHLGASSAPVHRLRRHRGLTDRGRRLVERLNDERIFVDLAHIHPDGFWDALDVHDRTHPVLVTHTGVSGVKPHWRNIDDAQIRAVAAHEGVIGIMAQTSFLRTEGAPNDASLLVAHMEHVMRVGGQACVALGTDFDGAIIPPKDLRSADAIPRLVQHMLDRQWSEKEIHGALGGNFLRVLKAYRP